MPGLNDCDLVARCAFEAGHEGPCSWSPKRWPTRTDLVMKVGRYRFGDDVVDVTRETLQAFIDNATLPMPVLVRHNQQAIGSRITQLFLKGDELWAEFDAIKLAPAFSLNPPMLHEVSITGHQLTEPEPLPSDV